MLQKVKIGDRTGAKEILNSILGTILFKDIGDLGILKVRLLELLSVLSRSAVEGGVDVDTMLEKNLAYVNKVMQIDTQEDLCAWISTALNEFIELVYSSQDARKMTQIRPAIDYIDAHYDKPITLAEIARASHLSVSQAGAPVQGADGDHADRLRDGGADRAGQGAAAGHGPELHGDLFPGGLQQPELLHADLQVARGHDAAAVPRPEPAQGLAGCLIVDM